MEKELTSEEIEIYLSDFELFIDTLQLFEKMTKKGKQATIDTLIYCLLKEV